MTQRFEMTDMQLEKIIDACKPVMMIALNCGMPSSPQENANTAWNALGKEMGFDHMTVKPISGMGPTHFTAHPTKDKHE